MHEPSNQPVNGVNTSTQSADNETDAFELLRSRLSWAVGLLAIALASIPPALLIAMWIYAWRAGLAANWDAEAYKYRGPWSASLFLVTAFDRALFGSGNAFLAGFVSWAIRPNRRAVGVMLISITTAIVTILHLGLVED